MNKRIEKLAREADEYADKTEGQFYGADRTEGQFYGLVWERKFKQTRDTKFAELIVRECAGIYDKIDNGNLHMGTDDYLEALNKTFFGVKE
jgi:hypothetical protein